MADPVHFADPFWEDPSGRSAPKKSFEYGHISFAAHSSRPIHANTADLVIVGQGTIAVKSKTTEAIEITVSGNSSDPKLILKITQNNAVFYKKSGYEEILAIYWLSIDRSNWVLRYGKYYTWNALTLLEVELCANSGKWLEKLKYVQVEDGSEAPNFTIKALPVTLDLPPIVVGNEAVSLRQLDLAAVTISANLPEACRKLYHNIAGPRIALEAEFKELADTIHKSVMTEGRFAYKLLREKCKTLKDLPNTYLRITIGSAQGNSPGIPYVMEIWPPGHKSPIHDHGNACAVIRVLSGSIRCTWYDTLVTGRKPYSLGQPLELKKDMVTWLGDNQYQIHELENTTDKTCVTLQCYAFSKDDKVHKEHFDFLENGQKLGFTPGSDYTFAKFCEEMEKECPQKSPGLLP
ncbi:uncharacterized protein N7503_010544 [Penicillium pulvis]|uniref:uncharacterized protein n=1 Tax=Penicillium pulvis TaxID=1562058 RepID=UPI0025486198|nr:uncharacterized protein N7503_010544 [Penicillium pulvis]KAJ5785332.1 hypothetical protein N7503_010544 [Penicillium pulvis]